MLKKVLLLGIDGATWRLLLPWIREGYLPTFRELLRRGAWGSLESTIPPWTIPAWNSLTTGKTPGKLRIYSFLHRVGKVEFRPYFMVRRGRSRAIWDILSESGFNCIVMNVPNVHKAYRINGCMVAGWLYLNEESLAYPRALKEDLDNAVGGYEVDIMDDYPLTDEEFIKRVWKMTKKRAEAFRYLIENWDWDFSFVVFVGSDRVQHRFWRRKHIILTYYQLLDAEIGSIIRLARKLCGDDLYVLLVSDHGFGPGDKVFNVNEWLRKKGYLKVRKAPRRGLSGLENIAESLRLLTVARHTLKFLPKRVREKLREEARTPPLEEVVDLEASKAFAYGDAGVVYVNAEGEKEYKRVREGILRGFAEIGVEGLAKEDAYGSSDPEAPDILIRINESVQAVSTRIGGPVFARGRRGNHRSDGIFVIHGPGAGKGNKGKLRIYDVTPTILRLFDLRAPEDIDGTALTVT